MFKRIKGFYQYNQEDCGAACLATVLNFHNIRTTISVLRNEMSYDKNGANILSIIEIAKKYGLEAEAYEGNFEQLQEQIEQDQFKYPMIVHVERENIGGHYLVIKRVHEDKVKVFDPKDGNLTLSVKDFIAQWTGFVICFEQNDAFNVNLEFKPVFKNYHRYLRILYKEKRIFIYAILLTIIISLISLIGAWIYKVVIDNYILKQSSDEGTIANTFNFTALIISLFVFYIFQTFLSLVKNFINAKAAKSLSNKLSESFLQHLIKIPQKNLSYFESGEVLQRFQSIGEIQRSYMTIIFTLSTEVIGALLGGVILFIISDQLFLYVVIMVAVYFIIFVVFLPLLRRNRKEYYSFYSESMTELNQTIVGNPTILMHKSSLWFFDKVFRKVIKSNNKLYNIGLLEGAASSLVTLTESMGSLAILWRGSQLVIQGTLSLGSLVAFQSMMTSFITPIQQLVLVQNEIQNLRILTQRLDDLYEVKTEKVKLPILKEEFIHNYNIKVIDVDFSYYYGQNVLKKINFEVKEGSKVGVIGNSGSGKTTMLKLIASLYSSTKGNIHLGDKPYKEYSLDSLRRDIAYVDQTPFVFEGTIIDNLIMGSPLREKNLKYINEIAEICDLYHLRASSINGLDMHLEENGNNLSGGQKQRIGIARALINEPKILLLDEATSNIDEEGKQKVLSYIYSLQGMTVISITHDKDALKYTNDFLVVKNDKMEMIEAKNIVTN